MIKLTDTSPCPIIGSPWEGRPMMEIQHHNLRWMHNKPWIRWRYPQVLEYIEGKFGAMNKELLAEIDRTIEYLFFDRYITYPETAQTIASYLAMSECKNVLEVGMHTGFTTLHMIKAIYPYGKVTGVDVYDKRQGGPADHCQTDIFFKLEKAGVFRFVHGETPRILHKLKGEIFDAVFVDSNHSLGHTELERQALWDITREGSLFFFHDCQKKQTPNAAEDGPIYRWLYEKVAQGLFKGAIYQTPYRLDTMKAFGVDHDRDLLCMLGVFVRQQ